MKTKIVTQMKMLTKHDDEDVEEVEIDDDLEVEVMVDGKQQAVSIGALKRSRTRERL